MPTLHNLKKPKKDYKEYSTGFNYNTPIWRKLRNTYIQLFPLCRNCLDRGITTQGTDVDHKLSIRYGGEPLEIANLQTLCKKCHASKSASERW